MTPSKEHILKEIDGFSPEQLRKLAHYISLLKLRKSSQSKDEEMEAMKLYSHWGDEDLELSEAGMSDYSRLLDEEDKL